MHTVVFAVDAIQNRSVGGGATGGAIGAVRAANVASQISRKQHASACGCSCVAVLCVADLCNLVADTAAHTASQHCKNHRIS
jgi:hypothetical protein